MRKNTPTITKTAECYKSSFTGELVAEGYSDYHHYKFINNNKFGVCLFLDGILQSSSKDQNVYHHNMTLCALKHFQKPKNVLIVGGAGGGILHHLLKSEQGPSIESICIVDIDRTLFQITHEKLHEWHNNEINTDPRIKIHYENGATFLKNSKNQYDLIFLDTCDPLAFTKSIDLYNARIYEYIFKVLSSNGALIYHSGPISHLTHVFYKSYLKYKDSMVAEYHCYPINIESFEYTWLFHVISKMGEKPSKLGKIRTSASSFNLRNIK